MASKLLKKGSEMYGKSLGPADMGLKKPKGVAIAPVSGVGGAKKR